MIVDIETNTASVMASIQADIDAVMPKLAERILEDCNYFCKQDQGGLIKPPMVMGYVKFWNRETDWSTRFSSSRPPYIQ